MNFDEFFKQAYGDNPVIPETAKRLSGIQLEECSYLETRFLLITVMQINKGAAINGLFRFF